jgi:hypothetical protein
MIVSLRAARRGGQAMDGGTRAGVPGAAPRIIVGGLQGPPGDPLPSPVVALSYGTEQDARVALSLLLSLQNGSRPFQMGPLVYLGDTNIKVRFLVRSGEGRRRLLCEVAAKAHPKHLTYAFYAAAQVDEETVKAFRQLVDMRHSYTLTVACAERVLTDAVDLVKYLVEEGKVPD